MSAPLAPGEDDPSGSSSDRSSEIETGNPFIRRLVAAALRLASVFYAAGAWIHRTWMRRTSAGRGRLACAVVSVGGLTVGGAAKTPLAAHLASALHERGWRVVLASRGYRGRGGLPVEVVSDGAFIHSSVMRSGDESLILAAHAPGVPVLVGRDRRIVGHHAVAVFDAQILVLDDGFQHHRLARDLDIVCIDRTAGLGNRRVLPAGPLREGIGALRHADWLCTIEDPEPVAPSADSISANDRDSAKAWAALLDQPEQESIRARRRPADLVALGQTKKMPLESLRAAPVGLLSGVARPASVRRTLESLGARVVAERRFRDHHEYVPRDCHDLDPGPRYWITTEKDALKILPEWLGENLLWVLRIDLEIEDEDAVLERIEARLEALGRLARDRTDPTRAAHEGLRA